MKEKYSTFKELSDKANIHKVKIKVIEKSRPFQSPGKKKYQRLVFQDENVCQYSMPYNLLRNNDGSNNL
jgi:hypothetical protein